MITPPDGTKWHKCCCVIIEPDGSEYRCEGVAEQDAPFCAGCEHEHQAPGYEPEPGYRVSRRLYVKQP